MKTGIEVDVAGYTYYYLNGVFHREDGPAVFNNKGNSIWYFNGKHHRVGGPAVEVCNGYTAYAINGKLHREDGPAIIYPGKDSACKWFLHGEQISVSNQKQFESYIKMIAFA